MAKKYLVPIDMSGLEIQNFLAHNLATAPTGVGGKVYFNTTDNKLYYYNGSSWVDLTASTDTTYTLTKSGSTITLTDSNGNHWDVTDDNTTYSEATTSASGLMSASDKTKVDGLGTASAKDYTTSVTQSGTDLPTAGAVYSHVASAVAAVDAMRFKGTIGAAGDNPDVTSLPTSGVKVGDTYRVITAGTYASQACEIGDLIIATPTTPTWTVAQTNIDGAITSITAGDGIKVTGSGASRTIATKLQEGTATISANSTSTTASVTDMVAYKAYDASTGEEVLISATQGSSAVTFSIASAYTHAITIKYLYMTT